MIKIWVLFWPHLRKGYVWVYPRTIYSSRIYNLLISLLNTSMNWSWYSVSLYLTKWSITFCQPFFNASYRHGIVCRSKIYYFTISSLKSQLCASLKLNKHKRTQLIIARTFKFMIFIYTWNIIWKNRTKIFCFIIILILELLLNYLKLLFVIKFEGIIKLYDLTKTSCL